MMEEVLQEVDEPPFDLRYGDGDGLGSVDRKAGALEDDDCAAGVLLRVDQLEAVSVAADLARRQRRVDEHVVDALVHPPALAVAAASVHPGISTGTGSRKDQECREQGNGKQGKNLLHDITFL